jgi:transcriptional regulator with XRE-family HTH domain
MQTTLSERLKMAMAGPPKVSGRALAKACGVSPPSVSDWLSGKSKTMEGSNLLASAEFLKIRAKWLADGVGPMRDEYVAAEHRVEEPSVSWLPDPKQDRLTTELLSLFSQLDLDGKNEYLIYLRGFVAGRRPHPVGNPSAIAG